MKNYGFCSVCWEVVDVLSNCCGNSGCGCSDEVYWSEWHNDPPRCCDPCDCYGNWTGPGNGPYRAPFAHAYAPPSFSGSYVAAGGSPVGHANSAANHTSHERKNVAKDSPRQHKVARPTQPNRAKSQVAKNRGAAAIVIRR